MSSVEIQPLAAADNQPNDWMLPIASLPQLLTGAGEVGNATKMTVSSDGTVHLTGSNTAIPTDTGTVIASGSLNASSTAPSQTGGTVQIVGDKVGLIGANINASGTLGGGTVRIGGDYQGKGTLPNASRTYVSSDSFIAADALLNGNGGKVIVWADETTRFYGNITARGGAQGGNGGFVETSGKQNLDFDGLVDVGATWGKGGQLLLDPKSVVIDTANDDKNQLDDKKILADDGSNNDTFKISADKVKTMLNSGDVSIAAKDNIDVKSAIDASGNTNTHNLKLDAATVNLNAPITLKGGLTINSTQELKIDASASLNLGGAFSQTGRGAVSTAGDITTSNDKISFSSPVTLTGNVKLDTGTGNGDIAFTGAIAGSGKNLELLAGTGKVDLGGAVGSSGTPIGNLTIGANTINLAPSINAAGVTLKPGTSGKTIGVGIGVKPGLDFILDQLNNITATNLTIGDATNTASIQIGTLLNPLTENLTFISKGTVDVTAPLSLPLPLSVTKNLTITNGGKLTIAPAADIILGGAFVQNGSGSVVTASNITAENGISFKSGLPLSGANIALDSEKGEYNDLKTIAGTGNIFFGKTVGAGEGKGLGAILIENATNVTALSTIVADSLTQLSGNTTTLAGDITTTKLAGVNITATNIQVGGSINTNGGKVNLIGNGGVTASNITSKGGEISLNSTQGAIATSNGTLDSSGGNVFLSANQNIATNNITSKGGAITLNSDTGAINTGALDSSATGTGGAIALTSQQGAIIAGNVTSKGATGGGAVTVAAPGSITTANIDTSSTNNIGGAIALTSQKGAVQTGNLISQGAAGGGDIEVSAQGIITAGVIDSSSFGKGGNVTLANPLIELNKTPTDDIQVVSINAQSGGSAFGGVVKITTDRFFRATGTFTGSKNPFATSISTIGGAGDGAILISHGGGSSFTPFVIGDATENGTAGALTTGTGFLSTILPSKEFPGPYRQGNIQIIPRRPGDNLLPYFGAIPVNTPASVSDVTIDTTSDLDSTITSKFDQHLGQTGNITNPKEAANLLSQIEKQTSIKSAFIYAVFAPDQVSSSQKIQIKKDDERLELILVTGEGKTKRVRVAGSRRGAILKVAGSLRNAITNKNKLNDDYRAPSEQLYQWLIAPIKDELEAQGIQNLVFIMDAGLR
ncbi:hypothetical protein [Coleofasciculus sp. H7-2]|uniref:beta strand repeat-containing protein n=1 Tax=Coleofasciculus sp. H7-2 TaxID=3351545 RepID=UPI0036721088